MHLFRYSLTLFIAFASGLSASASNLKMDLNQAILLYHRTEYDSAAIHLMALKSLGPWKQRDSLTLFQYLGMASSKLGKDAEALEAFAKVLEIDSLFQFPKNEDTDILHNFELANHKRVNPTIKSVVVLDKSSNVLENFPVSPRMALAPGLSNTGGKIGFSYGAIPLGTGWMIKNQIKSGVALGFLQAGGVLLAIYASNVESKMKDDSFGILDRQELATVNRWQWIQRISLSTALGAYLFSLIASVGE